MVYDPTNLNYAKKVSKISRYSIFITQLTTRRVLQRFLRLQDYSIHLHCCYAIDNTLEKKKMFATLFEENKADVIFFKVPPRVHNRNQT